MKWIFDFPLNLSDACPKTIVGCSAGVLKIEKLHCRSIAWIVDWFSVVECLCVLWLVSSATPINKTCNNKKLNSTMLVAAVASFGTSCTLLCVVIEHICHLHSSFSSLLILSHARSGASSLASHRITYVINNAMWQSFICRRSAFFFHQTNKWRWILPSPDTIGMGITKLFLFRVSQ